MIDYIVANKTWIFSGIGILVITGICSFIAIIFKRKKKNNSSQNQSSGNNSFNIQSKGNVTVNQSGATYTEIREIALDVFKANFMVSTGSSKKTANKRAEHITEEFLGRLQEENPSGLGAAEEPDFQDALFTVQKEYAKSGDAKLGDILVDLLINRSKEQHRSLIQLVLNEAIKTAPKLTQEQLAILSVIFLLRYTAQLNITCLESLGDYLDKYIQQQIPHLNRGDAYYQHLQYAGCGNIELGSVKLSRIWESRYQGLFFKGFELSLEEKTRISEGSFSTFIIPCLNNPSKCQVNALTQKNLEEKMSKSNLGESEKAFIKELFNRNKMSYDEIKTKIIEIRPYMSDFYDIWENSPMNKFQLTSVGIAIGHANIKKTDGEFTDLSIWIN